jgi:hypothetical protein
VEHLVWPDGSAVGAGIGPGGLSIPQTIRSTAAAPSMSAAAMPPPALSQENQGVTSIHSVQPPDPPGSIEVSADPIDTTILLRARCRS